MNLLVDKLRDAAAKVGYYDERGTWVNAEWMKDAADRLDRLETSVEAMRTVAEGFEGLVVDPHPSRPQNEETVRALHGAMRILVKIATKALSDPAQGKQEGK